MQFKDAAYQILKEVGKSLCYKEAAEFRSNQDTV